MQLPGDFLFFFFHFMQVKTFPDCLEQKYLTHKPSGEFIYEMWMEVKKNKQTVDDCEAM